MDYFGERLYIAKPKFMKMNPKLFAWLFFTLGLVFAVSSMLFALEHNRFWAGGFVSFPFIRTI